MRQDGVHSGQHQGRSVIILK